MTILPGDEPTADALQDAFPIFIRKTSDETVSSNATLQNDDELLLPVAASTTYAFWLWLIINTGTTPDFKFGWSAPVGATMAWSAQEGNPGALAAVLQGPFTVASVPPINGSAADQIVIAQGLVITSTTAGTLRLQWAQNTLNASNTSVKTSSHMRLWKMA